MRDGTLLKHRRAAFEKATRKERERRGEHAAAMCPRPHREQILTAIIGGLFAERRMPPGSVIDAGAHRGNWACYYAQMDITRTVWAMDPDPGNVAYIRRDYGTLIPNLRPVVGALGANFVANLSRGDARALGLSLYPTCRGCPIEAFAISTIDRLFANETLGFAHLDLEYHELEVSSQESRRRSVHTRSARGSRCGHELTCAAVCAGTPHNILCSCMRTDSHCPLSSAGSRRCEPDLLARPTAPHDGGNRPSLPGEN